jgi:hypothetical protein
MLELSLHTVVCGRSRKNIKLIESTTNTAIYFPPPFSQVYRYCPAGAQRRNPEEIFITGDTAQNIALAKQKIHELVTRTRIFMKDAMVSAAKIDSISIEQTGQGSQDHGNERHLHPIPGIGISTQHDPDPRCRGTSRGANCSGCYVSGKWLNPVW